jgi:hypothetical protein
MADTGEHMYRDGRSPSYSEFCDYCDAMGFVPDQVEAIAMLRIRAKDAESENERLKAENETLASTCVKRWNTITELASRLLRHEPTGNALDLVLADGAPAAPMCPHDRSGDCEVCRDAAKVKFTEFVKKRREDQAEDCWRMYCATTEAEKERFLDWICDEFTAKYPDAKAESYDTGIRDYLGLRYMDWKTAGEPAGELAAPHPRAKAPPAWWCFPYPCPERLWE